METKRLLGKFTIHHDIRIFLVSNTTEKKEEEQHRSAKKMPIAQKERR